MALPACRRRRSTRATDEPDSKVSSTIRRFSSSDRRRLFVCLIVSSVVCSEVSIYPFVDTYRCAHNGQHPYLLSIRPDGHEMTLTVLISFVDIKPSVRLSTECFVTFSKRALTLL